MEHQIEAFIVTWPQGTTLAHRFEDDGIAVFHDRKVAKAFASGYAKTNDNLMKVFPCTISFSTPVSEKVENIQSLGAEQGRQMQDSVEEGTV